MRMKKTAAAVLCALAAGLLMMAAGLAEEKIVSSGNAWESELGGVIYAWSEHTPEESRRWTITLTDPEGVIPAETAAVLQMEYLSGPEGMVNLFAPVASSDGTILLEMGVSDTVPAGEARFRLSAESAHFTEEYEFTITVKDPASVRVIPRTTEFEIQNNTPVQLSKLTSLMYSVEGAAGRVRTEITMDGEKTVDSEEALLKDNTFTARQPGRYELKLRVIPGIGYAEDLQISLYTPGYQNAPPVNTPAVTEEKADAEKTAEAEEADAAEETGETAGEETAEEAAEAEKTEETESGEAAEAEKGEETEPEEAAGEETAEADNAKEELTEKETEGEKTEEAHATEEADGEAAPEEAEKEEPRPTLPPVTLADAEDSEENAEEETGEEPRPTLPPVTLLADAEDDEENTKEETGEEPRATIPPVTLADAEEENNEDSEETENTEEPEAETEEPGEETEAEETERDSAETTEDQSANPEESVSEETEEDPGMTVSIYGPEMMRAGSKKYFKARYAPKNPKRIVVTWSLDCSPDVARVYKNGQIWVLPKAEPGTVITLTCHAEGKDFNGEPWVGETSMQVEIIPKKK